MELMHITKVVKLKQQNFSNKIVMLALQIVVIVLEFYMIMEQVLNKIN